MNRLANIFASTLPKPHKLLLNQCFGKELANLEQVSSLDFHTNKQDLIISYLLRATGVLVFGALFLMITKYLANNSEIILIELISIEIKSLLSILSIILILLDVVYTVIRMVLENLLRLK